MANATTSVAGDKPKLFPLRQRTGTAGRRLLSHAVDLSADNLDELSPRETVAFMAEARWGSSKFMPCPHCLSMDEHYWSSSQLRWKCRACGKRFSVTSGTVFADHKLSLTKILKMMLSWANYANGQAAVNLRKQAAISYKSAFVTEHKLREGLVRGFNVGILCGIQEMDGADMLGKRYREKRNRPQGGGAAASKPSFPGDTVKPAVDPETGEIVGPPKPPKYGKTARQPFDRRMFLVIRQRGLTKGRGAVNTRVAIALSESGPTVAAVAKRFASAESRLMTDEDPAYISLRKHFVSVDTVNHSKEFSKPGGISNNQAESIHRRARRIVEEVYSGVGTKYLTSYVCEAAWREDIRESSTGGKLRSLLKVGLSVGRSQWFCGYWQGRHRTYEMLVEGQRPALARGKKKGAQPRLPK